jgi:hypothetical protein
VFEPPTPRPQPAAEPDLDALLERARRGDPGAVPALRAALDGTPGLWERAGDVAAHAEHAWVALIAGDDELLREAVRRKAAGLRAEVAGPDPSPLEALLAARVVSTWLQVHYAEAASAQARDVPLRVAEFGLKRVESAARRFDRAVAALAAVRRLLGRADPSRAPWPAGPAALTLVEPGDGEDHGRRARRPAS